MPGRLRLAAFLAAGACALAACGSSATVGPSGPVVASAAASSGQPGDSVEPADSAQPAASDAGASDEPASSDQPYDAPSYTPDTALEAMLPTSFEGVPFDRWSMHVADVSAAGGDTSVFDPIVKAMGADPTQVALAFSADAAGVNQVQFNAYRYPGADSAKLLQALIKANKDIGQQVTTIDLGGKHVEKMANPTAPDSTSYLYVKGEVVLGVVAPDDAEATKALALLP